MGGTFLSDKTKAMKAATQIALSAILKTGHEGI
jgi:hypothetical protein